MGLSLIIAGGGGVAGATELFKFGSYEKTSIGTPLALYTFVLGDAAVVQFSTLRLFGVTSGYSVTAGKTLLLTRALIACAVAVDRFAIGYSDSDRGLSNAVDGANPVHLDSASANGNGPLAFPALSTPYSIDIFYSIPAGKFPRVVTPPGIVSQLYLTFYGHEV